jgi:sugar phosphate isomerase/epimerase
MLKLAFNSFSAPELSLKGLMETAWNYGYDGIELRTDCGHGHGVECSMDQPGRLAARSLLKSYQDLISVVVLGTSCRYSDPSDRDEQLNQTRRHLELAAYLDIPMIRVFCGVLPAGERLDKVMPDVISALRMAGEWAAQAGVTIGVETHDDWSDPQVMRRLMEQVNHASVGLIWDVMHTVRQGATGPVESYRLLKPWIRHVHVHDGSLSLERLEFKPMGEGEIDHRPILRLLTEDGYRGWISGEWLNWEPYGIHLPRERVCLRTYEQELRRVYNPVWHNPLRTREDIVLSVQQLLEPLKQYYSPGKALVEFGVNATWYPNRGAGVEAFTRPLWALAPLWAGGEKAEEWAVLYQSGISNGTNPMHEEYWGEIRHAGEQRMVEMAALGVALALAPGQVWLPLSAEAKQNLVQWMSQTNRVNTRPDNNWLFFWILANTGLQQVGAPYDQDVMDDCFRRIESSYLGDGWYSDGPGRPRDYYVSFAMHYYGLIYARLMEHADPTRSAIFKERAALFAKDYICWFASDGSAVPYGRSMIYRFAEGAFWSALVFAGVEALPWGTIKGLLFRHLRWWLRQPIYNSDGTLSIGYAYPNEHMAEDYNAPGSPYWSCKIYLILAIQQDHPFWQAKETALPMLPPISVQPYPGMVICHSPDMEHVVALASGQRMGPYYPFHFEAKYQKFAYSSRFGFSVSRGNYGLLQGAYDSMLALSEDDNIYRVRTEPEETGIDGNVVYSLWKPWPDVIVRTWLIPVGMWHVRIHLLDTGRMLHTAEGGFALTLEKGMHPTREEGSLISSNSVGVYNNWGFSGITDMYGGRQANIIGPAAGTNLMHPQTLIPTLTGTTTPGRHLLACAVLGEHITDKGLNNWRLPPEWLSSDDMVSIRTPDGTRTLFTLDFHQ